MRDASMVGDYISKLEEGMLSQSEVIRVLQKECDRLLRELADTKDKLEKALSPVRECQAVEPVRKGEFVKSAYTADDVMLAREWPHYFTRLSLTNDLVSKLRKTIEVAVGVARMRGPVLDPIEFFPLPQAGPNCRCRASAGRSLLRSPFWLQGRLWHAPRTSEGADKPRPQASWPGLSMPAQRSRRSAVAPSSGAALVLEKNWAP